MKSKKIIKIALLLVVLVVIGLGVKTQYNKWHLDHHKEDIINFFMDAKTKDGLTFRELESTYKDDVEFYYSVDPEEDMVYVTMYEKEGDGVAEFGYKVDLKNEVCTMVYSN